MDKSCSVRFSRRTLMTITGALLALVLQSGSALASGKLVVWGSQRVVPASELTGFSSVQASSSMNIGTRPTGTYTAWGYAPFGMINIPTDVDASRGIRLGSINGYGLTSSGSARVWGENDYGQTDLPVPNTGFVKLVGARSCVLGLHGDGSIIAWGRNDWGQCDVPAPNSGFVDVASGGAFSLGLRSDHTIEHWGYPGPDNMHLVPTPNADFVSVKTNGSLSVAIRSDSTAVAWGDTSRAPIAIPPTTKKFRDIYLGLYFFVGLMDDGSLLVWGTDNQDLLDVPEPNAGFIKVAIGSSPFCLGLREDGSVAAWGENGAGQCDVPAPAGPYVDIGAGSDVGVALRPDGRPVTWGRGNEHWGSPGNNLGFVQASISGANLLALRPDGTVAARGSVVWPELGQTVEPAPNGGFVQVVRTETTSYGVKADSSIVAWNESQPGLYVAPVPNTGFVGMSAHTDHAFGLRADGSLVLLGGFDIFATYIPEPNIGFAKVSSNSGGNVFLRQDGTADVAGYTVGLTVPEPNEDFIDVAKGGNFALALRGNGFIEAWGDTTAGQCNVPQPNADFIAVAAGYDHGVGLKSNGTVVAWGGDRWGQATVPQDNTGFVAIGASDGESWGIKGEVSGVTVGLPSALTLGNHPNPFNPTTTIAFTLPTAGPMRLEVYDLRGRLVRLLASEHREAGAHTVTWDGRNGAGADMASGVYLYRLTAAGISGGAKMTLVR